MEQLPYDEILIDYDDDSQSYYCVWRPLTSVGLGKTEAEALDDLRAAAHLGVETMVSSKLMEIGKNQSDSEVKDGKRSRTKRSNTGTR
jgi:predicted RNase H-like HicB family nuclease